jgi:hypothetical protein
MAVSSDITLSGSAGFSTAKYPYAQRASKALTYPRLIEELGDRTRCSVGMPSHYRLRAKHLRELADMTWQPKIARVLADLARDYDELAEDLEADRSQVRHKELLGE